MVHQAASAVLKALHPRTWSLACVQITLPRTPRCHACVQITLSEDLSSSTSCTQGAAVPAPAPAWVQITRSAGSHGRITCTQEPAALGTPAARESPRVQITRSARSILPLAYSKRSLGTRQTASAALKKLHPRARSPACVQITRSAGPLGSISCTQDASAPGPANGLGADNVASDSPVPRSRADNAARGFVRRHYLYSRSLSPGSSLQLACR